MGGRPTAVEKSQDEARVRKYRRGYSASPFPYLYRGFSTEAPPVAYLATDRKGLSYILDCITLSKLDENASGLPKSSRILCDMDDVRYRASVTRKGEIQRERDGMRAFSRLGPRSGRRAVGQLERGGANGRRGCRLIGQYDLGKNATL